MADWKAVLFDLDDTLYPERQYVLSGFRAVAARAAERCGVAADQAYAELSMLFEQGVRGNTFDLWLASHGLPASLSPELVNVYRLRTPSIDPVPEVPPLLRSLRRRFRIGLVSDGLLVVQQAKFACLGLAPAFDAVIFSDALGREAWKPSPLAFLAAVRELDVDPSEAIYVADNPRKDFLGARRAGLASVWCRHARGEYAAVMPASDEHCADYVVDSLTLLESLLIEPDVRDRCRASVATIAQLVSHRKR